ncbi:MAG: biopolymer transporter ExbD [Gammaproteobacteria bacterium]|nr:biopolymer transporter ExbD [Gammaproteobacteria bacterium]MYF58759.1 biopolymer transporter ExbD [Gammaproteobacteria bacterium]
MRLDHLVRRRKRAISMVPLIDVVFILLLFFMLSTSLIRAREIPVDFPTPDAEPSAQEVRIIRLESEDGSFTFEGLQYPGSDPEALQSLVATDPAAPYALDTAPGVSSQALVTLLDRLNMAGARNLSLIGETS